MCKKISYPINLNWIGGNVLSFIDLYEFLEVVGKLKIMKRSGWISQVGINKPESVADHSFRCAILAMCIGDLLDLDSGKLIRMMLLHDIHEAKTSDFDSQSKRVIGNLEIKKREKDAIQEILSFLPMRLGNK